MASGHAPSSSQNLVPVWVILLLGILALLCEFGAMGNPFPFSEQQFYLYGGGQILQHQIPYVDFWDRKPVGLFLLFAPIHLFGPYRFYAMPIIAGLFMWVGAIMIARITRLLSCGLFPSFLAGAVYLIGSNAYPDETAGQAEQFYIPLLIGAVLLIVQYWDRIQNSIPDLLKVGAGTMILLGMALEIKTSCVWDGVFLGIALLVIAVRQPNFSLTQRFYAFFVCGAAWIFVALIPTLLILAYYAAHGILHDWVWANITNHHLRSKAIGHSTAFFDYHRYYANFAKHALETCFFWGLPTLYLTYRFIALWVAKLKAKDGSFVPPLTPLFFIFAWGWVSLVASIQLRGGYAAVHYTMAGMPAAVILGAVLWQRNLWEKIFLLLPLVYFTPQAIATNLISFKDEVALEHKVASILNQQPGCLFQLSGSYLFYDLSPATSQCRVNKFLLSGMLTSPEEQFALGVNREDQFLHDLKEHPLYLVIDTCDERLSCDSRFKPQVEVKDGLWSTNAIDPKKRSAIQEIITNDYVPVFEGKDNKQGGDYVLYKLKDRFVPGIMPPNVRPVPAEPYHEEPERDE
ncbi:hypothetical protein FAI40_04635 [Acetobacteraceae bacterium]|nr:hypothetical protein FAI40_04635 [Acetobacteraceae bacterium]